jgi:hypothetical protein
VRIERKPRKSAAELQAEIALRLRIGGCTECLVTVRPSVGRRHMTGRNWDVADLADGCLVHRDLVMRTVRSLGNEYDCREFSHPSAPRPVQTVRRIP